MTAHHLSERVPRQDQVKFPSQVGDVEFRLTGKLVPEARRVCLCSSFNRWDTNAHEMRREPGGDWTVVVTLPSGVYSYLFYVDGVYYNDPRDDGRVPSEWGREYSLKVVR